MQNVNKYTEQGAKCALAADSLYQTITVGLYSNFIHL